MDIRLPYLTPTAVSYTHLIAMTNQPRVFGRSMVASLDGKNFFEYKTLSQCLAMETVVTASLSNGEPQEVVRCAMPSAFPQIVGYKVMYGDKEVGTLMTSEEKCTYSLSLTEYPDKSKFRIFAIIDDQKDVYKRQAYTGARNSTLS